VVTTGIEANATWELEVNPEPITVKVMAAEFCGAELGDSEVMEMPPLVLVAVTWPAICNDPVRFGELLSVALRMKL
jgi:hypothetical protein